jgi:hypothetical protein
MNTSNNIGTLASALIRGSTAFELAQEDAHLEDSSSDNDRIFSIVDQWSLQSVASARYLMGLYRKLDDEKQAGRACQAGAPAEERTARLQITAKAIDFTKALQMLPEEAGDALAWQNLLEAQTGICAFIALVAQMGLTKGLNGAKRANTKAFHAALQGYRTAFPDPLATEGICRALEMATFSSTEALVAEYRATPELRETFENVIMEGLWRAAGVKKRRRSKRS